MICSKCGNSIPKDDDFCPKCGHKITAEEHSYVTGIVKSSTIDVLKSPLFGVVCLSLVGFIVCIIIGWFMPMDLSNYSEGLSNIGAPKSITDIFDDVTKAADRLQIIKILILFIVVLPVLLSTIGMLILRSHAKGHLRYTGIDMVKVGIRVAIIYFSMIALGCLGGGVIFIVFGGYSDPTSLMWTAPAFVLVMGFVGAGLVLLVKLMSLAQIIKEAVTNDDFTEPPSRYMQVTSVLLGIFGVIIGAAILVISLDILTVAAIMLWSLAQIFLGIFIVKIRALDSEFYGGLYDTVYKKSTAVEYSRSFCPRCGRELWGAEICSCVPKYYNPRSTYEYTPSRAMASADVGSKGVKSTMPESKDRKSMSSGHGSGGKYFKKPNKL